MIKENAFAQKDTIQETVQLNRQELIKSKFDLEPRTWVHFKAEQGVHYELEILSTNSESPEDLVEIEMYTREGDIPSLHFHSGFQKGAEF
jgi:hypothetical protein